VASLADKINGVDIAHKAYQDAKAAYDASVAALGTISGDGDAVLAEGQAIAHEAAKRTYAMINGQIVKLTLAGVLTTNK
jgi:hypothetical protein